MEPQFVEQPSIYSRATWDSEVPSTRPRLKHFGQAPWSSAARQGRFKTAQAPEIPPASGGAGKPTWTSRPGGDLRCRNQILVDSGARKTS